MATMITPETFADVERIDPNSYCRDRPDAADFTAINLQLLRQAKSIFVPEYTGYMFSAVIIAVAVDDESSTI